MKRIYARVTALLLTVLLSLTVLCSCEIYFGDNTLENTWSKGLLIVHFLDVGQGDSIFIELPNGETMLIDSGENYRGEGIIDYIESCGDSDIDYLIGTHPHSDHIGSMAYIVRNFEIGSIYMPNVGTNTKTYENLLNAISKKGLKVKSAKSGMNILSEDDLSIDVLAPVKIDSDNLNNSSIVLKIVYGETSFLFTGDAEKGEINTIKSDISADVLKVGHHGSSTSTTKAFLKKVDPEIAVISCGRDNSYGHPHKETLDYLNSCGCEIYRTDTDNTVAVISDGSSLEVKTGIASIKSAK